MTMVEKLFEKNINRKHSAIWKRFIKKCKPTQDDLFEMFTAFEPSWCCAECGTTSNLICHTCGSTHIVMRVSREQFEIDYMKKLLKQRKEKKQ